MKKTVSIILVLAVALAVLAACAKPEPTGTSTADVTKEEPLEGQDTSYITPDEIANDTSRVAVTGITIEQKSLECDENSMFVLKPVFTPDNATYKDLIYISSDEEVVSFNEKIGAFFASVNGTAKVRIMTKDGGYYTTVTVKVGTGVKEEKTTDPNALTGISLSFTETELGEGDNMYISVKPIPATATITGAITWSSSDDSVAYIEGTMSDGYVVYGISTGEATITATTADGQFTASVKVTVSSHEEDAVTGVSLNVTEKTLSVGDSFTLKATVIPSSALNKFTLWMSSDDNIAEVKSDGSVTAKAPGTVTITVMTIEGGFTAECKVTVK